MKAQEIGIADESVDLVTMFEVMGVGFRGKAEDVSSVFEGIYRVLAPGGLCALTLRSRTFLEMFSAIMPVDWLDKEETMVFRRHVTPIIKRINPGIRIDWYGQIITPLGGKPTFNVLIYRDENFTGHTIWQPEDLIPRPIEDLTQESPAYWLGIWQKPR